MSNQLKNQVNETDKSINLTTPISEQESEEIYDEDYLMKHENYLDNYYKEHMIQELNTFMENPDFRVVFDYVAKNTFKIINYTPFYIQVDFNSIEAPNFTYLCVHRKATRTFIDERNKHGLIKFNDAEIDVGGIVDLGFKDVTFFAYSNDSARNFRLIMEINTFSRSKTTIITDYPENKNKKYDTNYKDMEKNKKQKNITKKTMVINNNNHTSSNNVKSNAKVEITSNVWKNNETKIVKEKKVDDPISLIFDISRKLLLEEVIFNFLILDRNNNIIMKNNQECKVEIIKISDEDREKILFDCITELLQIKTRFSTIKIQFLIRRKTKVYCDFIEES